MKYVTFICGHNSGRSQMAQGAFNHLKKLFPAVDREYEAISWGTGIGSRVNPKVIEPMKAIGIDLTNSQAYFPKDINHDLIQKRLSNVQYAFTMGCMDNTCELPVGMPIQTHDVLDWGLDDPAKPETNVIAVRDMIIGKILELLVELQNSDNV